MSVIQRHQQLVLANRMSELWQTAGCVQQVAGVISRRKTIVEINSEFGTCSQSTLRIDTHEILSLVRQYVVQTARANDYTQGVPHRNVKFFPPPDLHPHTLHCPCGVECSMLSPTKSTVLSVLKVIWNGLALNSVISYSKLGDLFSSTLGKTKSRRGLFLGMRKVLLTSAGNSFHLLDWSALEIRWFSVSVSTWLSSTWSNSVLVKVANRINFKPARILLLSFAPSLGSWPSAWAWNRPHLMSALARSTSLMSIVSIRRNSDTLSELTSSQLSEARAAAVCTSKDWKSKFLFQKSLIFKEMGYLFAIIQPQLDVEHLVDIKHSK